MKRAMALAAVLVLGSGGTRVYPAQDIQELVEGLRDDDPATVKAAQSMLIKLGPEAVGPLEKALSDPNFLVRERAAKALGEIGPPAKQAVPELVDLMTDAQYGVSTAAEIALVQIGEAAIPALVLAIRSDDPALRRAALPVLARCGPKAIPILAVVVKKEPNQYMRMRAAELLGDIHPATPEIIEALKGALWDIQEAVRRAAADSLGEHGAAALPALETLISIAVSDGDSMVRKKASDAILRMGPDAVAPLKALEQGADAKLKLKAQELLQQIPSPPTVSTPSEAPTLSSSTSPAPPVPPKN